MVEGFKQISFKTSKPVKNSQGWIARHLLGRGIRRNGYNIHVAKNVHLK